MQPGGNILGSSSFVSFLGNFVTSSEEGGKEEEEEEEEDDDSTTRKKAAMQRVEKRCLL
jgi:hypothetical protein